MDVGLREITMENVNAVLALAVRPDQERFVAANAVSLAHAHCSPDAWFRAVYADEDPAGFVMLADETLRPDPPAAPQVWIWRFMVDARFQGRGVGSRALERVVAHVRTRPQVSTLLLSYVPGPGCPEPFYLRAGFRHTGREEGGEIVLQLPLAAPGR